MCGILGVVGGHTDPEVFDRAVDRLRHRGPDDRGVECVFSPAGPVYLGFRRLSILDLSARGHQPMYDARRELCIVYNGEVYNYRSLREQLEAKGYRFTSETDTEVILNAYREWGQDAVHRFVGMFAFGLWDLRSHSLLLARDRLGIKPLYYWSNGQRLAFGSEPKAIIGLNGVARALNREAVAKYLTFLWVPAPDTLFEGIHQLEPGHLGVYRDGRLRISRYWNVPDEPARRVQLEEAEQELEALLIESIQLRMISDVPLGAFLSGGVDSSLIVALMAKAGAQLPIVTETVGYAAADQRFDIAPADAPYARKVRDHLGFLRYNEIGLHPDVVALLPRIVWHLDDLVADPAALSTYLMCVESKASATVMLSGMGAEELFGGYPRHRAALMAEWFRRLPGGVRRLARDGVVRRLPAATPWVLMRFARNAKKFMRSADLPFDERYLGFLSYYNTVELDRLLGHGMAGRDVFETHRRFLDARPHQDFLRRMTHLDLMTFLPSLNLAYTDKASMAASVEVRVPLLDHRVVEYVSRLPSGLLMRGRRQKYLLKRVAERYLPRSVVWRPKTGFGAPIRAWVGRDLKPLIRDLLAPDAIRQRGILSEAAVWGVIEDQWAGREDNALRIWALLCLEMWCQTFLDRDGAAPRG
jgi:asparagine synthase (glutamine-hydrolysing)